MLKFVPNNKRILVKVEESKNVSSGGIILAPTAKVAVQYAKIVAVSPHGIPQTDEWIYHKYAIGDTISFPTGCGMDIELEGEKYLLLSDEQILGAIVEEADKSLFDGKL